MNAPVDVPSVPIEAVLFHHVLGLTDGVRELGDRLTAAGIPTTTPDLFDGLRFDNIAAGIAHVEQIGSEAVRERSRQATAEIVKPTVAIGISMGTLPAQLLAQSSRHAVGAVLIVGCVDPAHLNRPWPDRVGAQLHLADPDPWNEPHEIRGLTRSVAELERFDYPGVGHLFMDSSTSDFDPMACSLLIERVAESFARATPARG